MRRSETTLFTRREADGHGNGTVRLAVRAGLVRQFGSGRYAFTPTGQRVRENVIAAVEAEMDAIGGRKVSLPQLNGSEIWERSGRWESFEGEMFTLEDRDGRRLCLAPSHEEGIVALVDGVVRSYEDLPVLLYQVGVKHRDDRARNGLVRTREFAMKDAYSLHASRESLETCYDRVRSAYVEVLEALDVEFVVAEAEADVMGGSSSEEFLALAEDGTVELRSCSAGDCRFGVTDESPRSGLAAGDACPRCGERLVRGEGIEVGHVFQLGTRYSAAMGLTVDAADGSERAVEMGSYGIGIDRLIHVLLEQHADDDGCRWSADGSGAVAPYRVAIVPLEYDGDVRAAADRLHRELGRTDALLFDDRDRTIGERFAESDLLGIPWKVVLGNHFLETGEVELETRDGETRYVDLEAVAEVVE
jgi:prolyl-tRNA synthetase